MKFTLQDLAIELYSNDYENNDTFKQFKISSALYNAPKIAIDLVLEMPIDITLVNGCAALICEQILQCDSFNYSTSRGLIEKRLNFVVKTANDIGAVMLLCKSLLLYNCPHPYNSSFDSCLSAAYKYKTDFSRITCKQADERLKKDARAAADAIYDQYGMIGMEALLGIEVLERYKNLR
ncbi:TPA: hypothetical protein ACSP1Y_004743 [Aeromonas hydrophila]|uniref:hypothetical protein n=1 Tax=Aeromonas salmonicida TaxID=645 RepID=UPI000F783D56|nr:hypothetical protein [Aeromonas salmonicida]RSM32296.1 hypothetical protein C5B78_01020 [Aeromonas salmonicida]